MRITNSLVNIRAITSHFQPRIDAWLAKEQLSTPSEEQILDVVRDNYDSLTLKLQEGLDQYDNYVESPAYTSFFTTLVRSIVSDVRQVKYLNIHLRTDKMLIINVTAKIHESFKTCFLDECIDCIN